MTELTRHTHRPADLFTQMRREMDDVFTHWFRRAASPNALAIWPQPSQVFTPCELQETEAEYVLRVDVPGMTDKDITVNVQNDAVTISGERKEQRMETKGQMHYTERSYGTFARTVAVPTPIKVDTVRARYKDGVMEIHLPKAQKTTSREIKVEHAP